MGASGVGCGECYKGLAVVVSDSFCEIEDGGGRLRRGVYTLLFTNRSPSSPFCRNASGLCRSQQPTCDCHVPFAFSARDHPIYNEDLDAPIRLPTRPIRPFFRPASSFFLCAASGQKTYAGF